LRLNSSSKETFVAHIHLPEGLPGIVGLLTFSPDTAQPLMQLAELLLRGPNTLTSAEREMIAAHVSYRNKCDFCQLSHSASAATHLDGNLDLVDHAKTSPETAPISDKLKALLNIAGKVQEGGKTVTAEDIARARRFKATDKEIHDTVLIASAFCMYNRYVDGLGTLQPKEPEVYREMGERMARQGYGRGRPEKELPKEMA
jgi:uncharacterized peroxidase-related enzyme